MSLIDFIISRRSIRRYEKRDIPEEVLKQIFEAGRQAPSAVNKQPIHFIVVKDDEKRKGFPACVTLFGLTDLSRMHRCHCWMCRCQFTFNWKMGYLGRCNCNAEHGYCRLDFRSWFLLDRRF
jgi:hypothetical protein